jgi:hypothetical protein
VLWRVKVWGSRPTISAENTLVVVQEDFSLLLAVTHQSNILFQGGYSNVVLLSDFNVFPEGF